MRILPTAGLLLLAITGCAPSVQTVYLGPQRYPAGDSEAAIRLYSAGQPECPFEELAILTSVLEDPWFSSREDALEALKERARQLGAHAIVGLEPHDVPHENGSTPGFKGTAVRFTEGDCTE